MSVTNAFNLGKAAKEDFTNAVTTAEFELQMKGVFEKVHTKAFTVYVDRNLDWQL